MRITANQVTFARLIAMPLLCGLVYGGEEMRYAVVFLGTAIGITDTLDGYLARKHGPTVLGGLMDPIADKVFIAVTFLPVTDLGWVPPWLVGALFLREFLVTALRSTFERRGRRLASSYFAKVKTWVQMAGVGLVALIILENPVVLWSVLLSVTIGAALGFAIYGAIKREAHRSLAVGAICFGVASAFYFFGGGPGLMLGLFAGILLFTWGSALPYFVEAFREFRENGVEGFDLVRVLGAAAIPALAIGGLTASEAPAAALITVVAVETAHAGLDNLLAHHHAAASAGAWGARTLGISALLGVSLAIPSLALGLSIAAAAISVVATVVAFYRGRRWYLDAPPEPLSPAAEEPASEPR